MNDQELLVFNGIDGTTGDYLLPPLTAQQVSKIAQGEEFDPALLTELQKKTLHLRGLESDFAPIEGVDPKNLAETGWGVIFAHEADPAIREALSPLLEHRRQQATQNKELYYREYIGVNATTWNFITVNQAPTELNISATSINENIPSTQL